MAIKKLKSALLKVDEVKTRDITEADKLVPSRSWYIIVLKILEVNRF